MAYIPVSEARLLLIRVLGISDLSGLPKWGTLALQVFTATMWSRSTYSIIFVVCGDNVHCLHVGKAAKPDWYPHFVNTYGIL